MSRILPKRGLYRVRAHVNPFSINTQLPFPPHHSFVDWRKHFPMKFGGSLDDNFVPYCNSTLYPAQYQKARNYDLNDRSIDILDIGCGYGGLLFALAPLFPNKLIIGMQIREKIAEYVSLKIRCQRILYPQQYDHISVIRTNTMKYLCNYIPKNSIEKIFICFPDPHFKAKTHKRRIINTGFLSEYAYLLKTKGKLYCVTDVQDLHKWHMEHLNSHSMFKDVSHQQDQCVHLMTKQTQESRKVQRQGRKAFWAVFQKNN